MNTTDKYRLEGVVLYKYDESKHAYICCHVILDITMSLSDAIAEYEAHQDLIDD